MQWYAKQVLVHGQLGQREAGCLGTNRKQYKAAPRAPTDPAFPDMLQPCWIHHCYIRRAHDAGQFYMLAESWAMDENVAAHAACIQIQTEFGTFYAASEQFFTDIRCEFFLCISMPAIHR